ncbi:UNC-50 [Zopfochytrium polystomum]|nr:UNC-50 [Zopfochytrium polystomum]
MLPTSRASTSSSSSPSYSYDNLSFNASTSSAHPRRHKRSSTAASTLATLAKRLTSLPQMDFELALWQMLYICIAPRRVYRSIYYHKQTKNQWARDDPAFYVILSLCLSVTAIAYGIAYALGFAGTLKLILFMVLVDYFAVGVVVASILWAVANNFLLQHGLHSAEQSVEWAYAFDVHSNSFFPAFLITYVLQFFFLPIVVQDGIISVLFGNTMYFVAICFYLYITYLGYNALPFLKNTSTFLYPTSILILLYLLSLVLSFNVSRRVLDSYFN